MCLDRQTEEGGAAEAGGGALAADRENIAAGRDVATEDACGGAARRPSHTEEKTGSQHQRPY